MEVNGRRKFREARNDAWGVHAYASANVGRISNAALSCFSLPRALIAHPFFFHVQSREIKNLRCLVRFYIYDAVIFNSMRKVFFRDSRFYENSTAI